MPTASSTSIRSGLRILDPDYDLLPGEASLDNFVLEPPSFKPQTGGDVLHDGEAISRFGERVRDAYAEVHGIDPADVPHGLIRLLELISADNRHNEKSVGVPRTIRNRLGTITGVSLLVHTPLIFPWLINGRALQRIARIIRGRARLLTHPADHDDLHLPQLNVDDVDQILEHYQAQRQILELHEYSGADRDFIDDIAANGVLEEIILTPTYLHDGTKGNWSAQATDGARRVTAAHELIRFVTGESPAVFQRAWFDRDMTQRRLQEIDADTIHRLHDELTFPRTELQLYPTSGRDKAISRWLEEVASRSDQVQIFQRVRTLQAFVVLAATPNDFGESAHQVILEDVRSRHIDGARPEPWDDAAVRAQTAIGSIEALHTQGVLSDEQSDIGIGNSKIDFRTGPITPEHPYRDALRAVASLAGILTATQHREFVNVELRRNHQWPHPSKRARALADQMLVVIEREDHKQAPQIAAAMSELLKSPRFWRTHDHPDSDSEIWTDLLDLDLDTLLQRAKDDLADPIRGWDPSVGSFRPARRALGILGGLALIINPMLVDYQYADGNRGAQLSQSGRGGRLRYSGPSIPEGEEVPVGTSDPTTVVSSMLRNIDGLEELATAIRALTGPEIQLPLQPDTGEIMDDAYLRYRWLGEDSDGPEPPIEEDPIDHYWLLVDGFFDGLHRAEDSADQVQELVDDNKERLFLRLGLTDEQADLGKSILADLQEFVVRARFIRQQREEG